MAQLFDVPLEVRQMIYAECLTAGKIYPYTISETIPEHDFDTSDDEDAETKKILQVKPDRELPCFELLIVCKAIRQEAEPLLYQRNTVVLPAIDLTARFFKHCLHNDTRRSWIKSITLIFDSTDMVRREREIALDAELAASRETLLFPEEVVDCSSEDEIFPSSKLHDAYKAHMTTVVWPRKASYVLDYLALNKLTIDVRGSNCIEGCCNLQSDAISALKKGFMQQVPDSVHLMCSNRAWRDRRGGMIDDRVVMTEEKTLLHLTKATIAPADQRRTGKGRNAQGSSIDGSKPECKDNFFHVLRLDTDTDNKNRKKGLTEISCVTIDATSVSCWSTKSR